MSKKNVFKHGIALLSRAREGTTRPKDKAPPVDQTSAAGPVQRGCRLRASGFSSGPWMDAPLRALGASPARHGCRPQCHGVLARPPQPTAFPTASLSGAMASDSGSQHVQKRHRPSGRGPLGVSGFLDASSF